MKRFLTITLAAVAFAPTYAVIPQGYYSGLEGKSGSELKAAVKAAARPATFSRVDYGEASTWGAFLKTDVRRIDDGEPIWWDMYSNNLVRVSNHDGLNIEHSVANSWFGAKKGDPDAYSDLFHLNPSNEAANNQKSSNPIGIVAKTSWTNGLVKVGAPAQTSSGASAKVFEPADEYKGDFARAYFYIFTAYDTAPWKTDQSIYSVTDGAASLDPATARMLAEWAKADPVDSKEISRNEEIFLLQKNRNPFIDYPELIEYIWGDLKGKTFHAGKEAVATDRPEAPRFAGEWLTGVNTYSGRWWTSTLKPIETSGGDLMVSINGGDYEQYGPGITIPAAAAHGETLSLKAYTEWDRGGTPLRSSIASLTLTALDPSVSDYTEAIWTKVTDLSQFKAGTDSYYIILSRSNAHIMGHAGGTSASSFMPDAGFTMQQDENIARLPVDAALLRFEPKEEGKYLLEVLDPINSPSPRVKGYWNMNAASSKNTLKPSSGTAATVEFASDGSALISFGSGRTLQYNKTQPRFTNYNSSQTGISLYRFNGFRQSAVTDIADGSGREEGVAIDGRDIILPEGWRLFDIRGCRMAGKNLSAGIYIALSPKGKSVKILIP